MCINTQCVCLNCRFKDIVLYKAHTYVLHLALIQISLDWPNNPRMVLHSYVYIMCIYTSAGGVESLLLGCGLGERGDSGVLAPPPSHGDVRGVTVPDSMLSVSNCGVGVADSSQKVSGGAMTCESSSSVLVDTPSWEEREIRSAGGRSSSCPISLWRALFRILLVLVTPV